MHTRLIGEYNFPNAQAAVTIGHFFGVEAEKIDKALNEYEPRNNRSQLKKTADNTLIIDANNANPTSMMAAIGNFRNMQAEKKMLILGDMLLPLRVRKWLKSMPTAPENVEHDG